jgi:hypothetical protein
MKGDRVEIVIDAGDATKTYDVSATRAGRRVEVVSRRGMIEVSELTRSGTAIRTARFMTSRVIAVVEHPARGAVRTRGDEAPVSPRRPGDDAGNPGGNRPGGQTR